MSCSPSFPASSIVQTCGVEDNDDLLTIILAKLPAKSIYRFQCVSTRWKFIISSSFFRQSFYDLRKELALAFKMVAYVQETFFEADSDNSRCRKTESIIIVPVAVSVDGQKLFDKETNGKGCYFVNSSNGLILLQSGHMSYRIFNPITNWCVRLTREDPLQYGVDPAMALVCEENIHDLVANYKIVLAGNQIENHSSLTVNTFCSKTNKWTTSIPTATGRLNDKLHSCSTTLVVDGIIYWFTSSCLYLVVYYMESNTIQLVDLPSECDQNYSSRVARSSRDDDLWLCIHMAESSCIRIWMVSSTQYESYRSRSSTIPRDAWILIHEFNYSVVAPARSPAWDEEVIHNNCICRSWWRGGVQRKVPYVDFYIEKHREPRIYNRYEFSPYMEALTLSSYAF